MDYWSRIVKKSTRFPGVEFTVARLSLSRRIELGHRIREIGAQGEFLAASDRVLDQIDAGLMQRRIERAYLEWGLLGVSGLRIDGEAAGPGDVVERGPEELTAEILAAIRAELHLSVEERKN